MGAQWKQAGREANAQVYEMTAKLVREIMIRINFRGPDPDLNCALSRWCGKGEEISSVYRDTIERASRSARLTKRSITRLWFI